MDNISDIIIEASDENTLPDQLESIYQQHRNRGHKLKITNALASNPNASIELLKQLFINEPGMANIVLENPILPLLLLENYEILKSWTIEGRNKIFTYKQPSKELQKIGLSTNDKSVWLELVKLSWTDIEIIEAIASSFDWHEKKNHQYQNFYIKQHIAKHNSTSANTLIKIIRDCDDDNICHLAYANAVKNPNKKLEIDNYFTRNPLSQHDWVISITPKLESFIAHRQANKKFEIQDGNMLINFDNYQIKILTSINIISFTTKDRILFEYCSESKTVYWCCLSSEDMIVIENSLIQF